MSTRLSETGIWNLIRGALGTRALAVVAELKVADARADGGRLRRLGGSAGKGRACP
jgi:hypothetical protein